MCLVQCALLRVLTIVYVLCCVVFLQRAVWYMHGWLGVVLSYVWCGVLQARALFKDMDLGGGGRGRDEESNPVDKEAKTPYSSGWH